MMLNSAKVLRWPIRKIIILFLRNIMMLVRRVLPFNRAFRVILMTLPAFTNLRLISLRLFLQRPSCGRAFVICPKIEGLDMGPFEREMRFLTP